MFKGISKTISFVRMTSSYCIEFFLLEFQRSHFFTDFDVDAGVCFHRRLVSINHCTGDHKILLEGR